MNSILRLEAFASDEADLASPILPSFGPPESVPEEVPEAEEEAGGISEAYDLGYQTGWAARDLELQQSYDQISQDFQENLHALSFTLEEARQQVLAALLPLLRALVGRALPYAAQQSWGDAVVAAAKALADEASELPITVALSPRNQQLLAPRLADVAPKRVHLDADAQLGPHQALLRLGPREALLDIDGLLAAIDQRVAAAFSDFPKDLAHG